MLQLYGSYAKISSKVRCDRFGKVQSSLYPYWSQIFHHVHGEGEGVGRRQMGLCCCKWCVGDGGRPTPDPETRRKQMAAAAEQRRAQQELRGLARGQQASRRLQARSSLPEIHNAPLKWRMD